MRSSLVSSAQESRGVGVTDPQRNKAPEVKYLPRWEVPSPSTCPLRCEELSLPLCEVADAVGLRQNFKGAETA